MHRRFSVEHHAEDAVAEPEEQLVPLAARRLLRQDDRQPARDQLVELEPERQLDLLGRLAAQPRGFVERDEDHRRTADLGRFLGS